MAHLKFAQERIYNPQLKSLARLDQIYNWNIRWQAILETTTNGITGIRNPLNSPPTMLEMSNDNFITINNIELGEGGKLINFCRVRLKSKLAPFPV